MVYAVTITPLKKRATDGSITCHLVMDKLVPTVIQTHQLGNHCLRPQSAPLKVGLNFIPKARDPPPKQK